MVIKIRAITNLSRLSLFITIFEKEEIRKLEDINEEVAHTRNVYILVYMFGPRNHEDSIIFKIRRTELNFYPLPLQNSSSWLRNFFFKNDDFLTH